MSLSIKVNDIVTITARHDSKFKRNQKVRVVEKYGAYSFYVEDLDNVVHGKVYRYYVWKNPIEKLNVL